MKESNLESNLENNPSYSKAIEVLTHLENNGFEAWLAGGCVRDSFLGLAVSDFDFATSALPQEVIGVFGEENCLRHGEKFGSTSVKFKGELFEITTFRSDLGSKNNRHPEKVVFSTKEEDVMRRDFSVNGLLYHPERGVFDIVNGREDLKNNVLRAIGEPDKRFEEDALRILRLYRFSINYSLDIENKTLLSAASKVHLLKNISHERISSEIKKVLDADKNTSIKHLRLILKSYKIDSLLNSLEFKLDQTTLYAFVLAYFELLMTPLRLEPYIFKKLEKRKFYFFKNLITFIRNDEADKAKCYFLDKVGSFNMNHEDKVNIWLDIKKCFPGYQVLEQIINSLQNVTREDLILYREKRETIIKENSGEKIRKLLLEAEYDLYFKQVL